MYSVVLLMAMTTGGESADFGHRASCGGCSSSCHSSHRLFGHRRHSCHGCTGYACTGYACTGYACTGYACTGYAYAGCCGGVVVTGKPTTTDKKVEGGGAAKGKSDNEGTVGGGTTAEDNKLKPGTALSADEQKWLKEMVDAEKDATEKKKIETDFKADSHVGRKATYEVFKKMKSGDDTAARLIVKVPANARLTVDGQATYSTSAVRTFETPELTPGKQYAYVLKAEFQQDGKMVSVTRRVPVAAGKTIRVDLNQTNVVVASK